MIASILVVEGTDDVYVGTVIATIAQKGEASATAAKASEPKAPGPEGGRHTDQYPHMQRTVRERINFEMDGATPSLGATSVAHTPTARD